MESTKVCVSQQCELVFYISRFQQLYPPFYLFCVQAFSRHPAFPLWWLLQHLLCLSLRTWLPPRSSLSAGIDYACMNCGCIDLCIRVVRDVWMSLSTVAVNTFEVWRPRHMRVQYMKWGQHVFKFVYGMSYSCRQGQERISPLPSPCESTWKHCRWDYIFTGKLRRPIMTIYADLVGKYSEKDPLDLWCRFACI